MECKHSNMGYYHQRKPPPTAMSTRVGMPLGKPVLGPRGENGKRRKRGDPEWIDSESINPSCPRRRASGGWERSFRISACAGMTKRDSYRPKRSIPGEIREASRMGGERVPGGPEIGVRCGIGFCRPGAQKNSSPLPGREVGRRFPQRSRLRDRGIIAFLPPWVRVS